MARKKKGKKDEERLKLVRTADHRSHYIIGAIPQITEDDLRLHMYTEVVEGPDGPYYVTSTQVIMPKSSIPKLIDTLDRTLKTEKFEKAVKSLPMPMDIALAADLDILEKGKKGKKKVQKIRRK